MEGLLHQFQDAMDGTCIGKGSEIAGTIAKDPTCHGNAWILFLERHLDIRIGLIVAKHDIVPRMMLLMSIFSNMSASISLATTMVSKSTA